MHDFILYHILLTQYMPIFEGTVVLYALKQYNLLPYHLCLFFFLVL